MKSRRKTTSTQCLSAKNARGDELPNHVPGFIAQQTDFAKRELARYQAYRGELTLGTRLLELLWSWHLSEPGLNRRRLPGSSVHTAEPLVAAEACNFVPDKLRAGKVLWCKKCFAYQRQFGDGFFEDRRALQLGVLERMKRPNPEAVCLIAEQVRDAAWLDALTKVIYEEARDRVTPQNPDGQIRKALDTFDTLVELAEERLLPLADAPYQRAYLALVEASDALNHILIPAGNGRPPIRVRNELYGANIFIERHPDRPNEGPRGSHVGGQKAPWVQQADAGLKKLKLAEIDREDLLIAWCVKPPSQTRSDEWKDARRPLKKRR